MRAFIAVLLLSVGLVACGGAAPTVTPVLDLTTMSGYRTASSAHMEAITQAINTANSTCTRESLEKCTQSLKDQEARFRENETFIRNTKAPQGCMPLFGGYLGLVINADDFFTAAQRETRIGTPDSVKQIVADQYAKYTRGKAANDSFLANDSCK